MAKIAYIRASAKDQNTDRQRDALEPLGIDRVFEEKRSGKNAARPELKKLMDYAREGDMVYFESISRLARNTRDFLDIMEIFHARGVAVVSLKEPIDTTTPAGKLIYTIFAALAEMERENIHDRQAEGIASARRRGKRFGRPPAKKPPGWDAVVGEWCVGKMTARAAWEKLGLKKSTFYKLLNAESRE